MLKRLLLVVAAAVALAAPLARAQDDASPTPTAVPSVSDSTTNSSSETTTTSASPSPGEAGNSTTELPMNVTASTMPTPSTNSSGTSDSAMDPMKESPTTEGSSASASSSDATTSPSPSRDSSGRAFGFDSNADNSTVEKGSLQDLSLDDIDMSMFMTTEPANETMEGPDGKLPSSTAATATAAAAEVDACVEPKGTFAPGQRFHRGCDESCVCMPGGRAECAPRCSGPMFRRGSRQLDADCFERDAVDPCCSVLVCAGDTETEPVEECQFKNQTYQRGESFKDGCESVCICGEAGNVSCKPRCSPVNATASDRCVALPDPVDACCSVLRCDVTLTDHDVPEAGGEEAAAAAAAGAAAVQLVAAEAVNATTVLLEVGGELPENATVEASTDRATWTPARRRGPLVTGLEPGRTVFLRAVVGGVASNVLQVALPAVVDPNHEEKTMEGGCVYKGSNHSLGEQFHDGCKAFCECTDHGVQCADLECPTDFGLDVLDPHCLHWEVQPVGFEATPPRCCPDSVRCVNNGSCEYGGERFANFAQIPARLTGCERRCYCDAGNVTCQPACQPMPAAPPADLSCPPHEARLEHVPGDDCCLFWTCPAPQHPGHSTPGMSGRPLDTDQTSHGPSNTSTADDDQTLPGPIVLDRTPATSSTLTPDPTTASIPTAPTTTATTTTTTTTTTSRAPASADVPLPGPVQLPASKPGKAEKPGKAAETKPASPSTPGKGNVAENKKNPAADHKSKEKPGKEHASHAPHDSSAEDSGELRPFDVRPPFLPVSRPHDLDTPNAEDARPDMHGMHDMHEDDEEQEEEGEDERPFLGPLSPQPQPPGPHHHELPEHVLHELQQQGLFPGQARPPPPPPAPGRPPHRPPATPGAPEEQEIYLHHLLPPQARPAPPRKPTQGSNEEQELIHHLQQQGLLPPEKEQRPGGRPGPPRPPAHDQDLLHHLQQQGLFPPQHPAQKHPRPGPGQHPDADEQEILLHLQQQGLIPPGAAGLPPRPQQDPRRPDTQHFLPPQGRPDRPQGHDPERELYLHLQQQGLIPPQPPQNKPVQKRPFRPPPDHEQEILHHLQQQGLIPTKPGSRPPQHALPGADQQEILVHLHPQGTAPQPGKAPPADKTPSKTPPHDEDTLAQFQQGLLPFQQHQHQSASGRPAGPPSQPPPPHPGGSRHPPLTEEELIFQLQQQGLLPPGATLPGAHPHPPLLLPPPPPPGAHFKLPSGPGAPRNRSHADYAVTSNPGGFPHLSVSGQPEEVAVQTLEPVDATAVRVVFAVPPVFVGLHGRIELRYTADKNNDDLSSWKLQILAPPQDLLATPTLEFTLGDLRPDTEYRVKITVLLRDLHNTPSSPVLSVRTLPLPSTTLPPVVMVSPELSAAQVNNTWAVISWRRFSDSELQLIDGVQLRYKQLDDKVYSATPLIHRAVTSYTLENLQPSTTYEVGIFFIPFQGQTSELQADSPIQITTTEAQDLYKFEVHVEVHHIKVTSVEVNWTGVPYPEDKYVNIYRAIYQSDSGKEDFSTFTVAKRDSTSSTLIKDLAPGTRYRLWLEVYLTNGKIKKSNVQDFSTRPGSVASVGSSHQGKLESTASPVKEVADYYSPLVAVAILAALAIMATLILLLMLMKRRGQTKAAISAGRKSQSAYDNPSYKTCEDQQPAANGNGSAAKATPAAAPAPEPA